MQTYDAIHMKQFDSIMSGRGIYKPNIELLINLLLEYKIQIKYKLVIFIAQVQSRVITGTCAQRSLQSTVSWRFQYMYSQHCSKACCNATPSFTFSYRWWKWAAGGTADM